MHCIKTNYVKFSIHCHLFLSISVYMRVVILFGFYFLILRFSSLRSLHPSSFHLFFFLSILVFFLSISFSLFLYDFLHYLPLNRNQIFVYFFLFICHSFVLSTFLYFVTTEYNSLSTYKTQLTLNLDRSICLSILYFLIFY